MNVTERFKEYLVGEVKLTNSVANSVIETIRKSANSSQSSPLTEAALGYAKRFCAQDGLSLEEFKLALKSNGQESHELEAEDESENYEKLKKLERYMREAGYSEQTIRTYKKALKKYLSGKPISNKKLLDARCAMKLLKKIESEPTRIEARDPREDILSKLREEKDRLEAEFKRTEKLLQA
ncbi:MAG: hypothetical protein QXS54_12220, partial [Candidatus Methanomethylicaceae archaeon]